MRNVRNVLDIGVFETETVQGFEQVGRGADALDGGFEDVFGIGFGVDEQRWAFGNVAVEGEVAVLERFDNWHSDYSTVLKVTASTVTKQWGGGHVQAWSTENSSNSARPKAPCTQPPQQCTTRTQMSAVQMMTHMQ